MGADVPTASARFWRGGKGCVWESFETHSQCHHKFSSDVSNFFNFRSLPCFLLCSTDFDANNIFKAFFGGPGGFSFEGE